MHLSQITDADGARRVVFRDDTTARVVTGATTTYDLAREAIAARTTLADAVRSRGLGAEVDLAAALAEGRVHAPINHPDPAHLHLTGTGLTHLGSAATRDAMHAGHRAGKADRFDEDVPHGPRGRQAGARARSACSRNGSTRATARSPWRPARRSLAGLRQGRRRGAGDRRHLRDRRRRHAVPRSASRSPTSSPTTSPSGVNYLFLAHSKLRERVVRAGDPGSAPLPDDVAAPRASCATARLLWEKPFLSGEANMSHTIANLEHHHFKYGLFRQPGDVHVHMFGTATLSLRRRHQDRSRRRVRDRGARISACRCATRWKSPSPPQWSPPSPSYECFRSHEQVPSDRRSW